jgi:hypothetical protein
LQHEVAEASASLRAAEASASNQRFLDKTPDPFLLPGPRKLGGFANVVQQAQERRYGEDFDITQDYRTAAKHNTGHPEVRPLTEVEKYLGYRMPETTRRPSLYPEYSNRYLGGGGSVFSLAQQSHICEAAMRALIENGISPKTSREKYSDCMNMVRQAAANGKEIVINPY